MLTALRIINIAIWGWLFFFVLPGAWTAVRGREVRRGDPWRLSVAAVALVIILGNVRWLLAADSYTLFIAVYTLSALVGIYKIILVRAYGRGPIL